MSRKPEREGSGARSSGASTFYGINQLAACLTIGDLTALPQLRFHPLKGQLDGLYAIDLGGPTRLFFSFADEAKTIVRVEEVSKHYD